MKIFISADIEGVSSTTLREECNPSHPFFPRHAEQMTKEVIAACEGAFMAGAKEIYVKDAHGPGCNIDPTALPENVKLLRGWTGHPYMMVEGIDHTFDAAMFVGYHAAAGRNGNPLSHTLSGRHVSLKINGAATSEFGLYSMACALEGVPSVFLSGDKMLCDDEKNTCPQLITVPVKEGAGGKTINYSPADVLKAIKDKAAAALKQDLTNAAMQLPEHFAAEVYFKEHSQAEKASYFPGVTKANHNIVQFENHDLYEILRTLMWIMY